MPISISWYDETKRIVFWEFEGNWTIEQLHIAYTESHNLCMTVPEHKVIALLDVTRSANTVPSNIFSALTTRRRTQAPNFDMIVIVSSSSLIKIFVNIMMKMPALRDQFALYESLDEALAFIHERQSQQLESQM
ncbi:MAG: hypothetical protein GC179_09450 [Anaerolineaceae bacterium]|nr:hypothetical protein [Anaerolineaceae bacterium]